jgi:hypothetical protein
MLVQQSLGISLQSPLSYSKPVVAIPGNFMGLLGNREIQSVGAEKGTTKSVRRIEKYKPTPLPPKVSNVRFPSARLEALKKQKFAPEGRQERIAIALAALRQETAIHLPLEEWRRIAEDSDLEDQF